MPRDGMLITSPSQHSTWEECPSRWWLAKVARVPEPSKDYFTAGTVGHSVIERYLTADDLGRMPDGSLVNLYPPGWEWKEEKMRDAEGKWIKTFDRISPELELLIPRLIELAITQGHLARWPNRRMEVPFGRVWKDEAPVHLIEHRGIQAVLTGVMDLLLPGVVRDWKFKKNLRYTVSKKRMAHDIQMMQYAKVARDIWLAEGLDYQTVNIGHLTFSKNPDDPRIKPISIDVTADQIDAEWALSQARAAKMIEHSQITDFDKVPSVGVGDRACAYCSRVSICLGTTSIPDYTQKVMAHEQHRFEQLQRAASPHGDPTMGLLGDLAGKPPAPAAAPAAPPAAPVASPTDVPVLPKAPWARDNCMACQGSGVSSVGDACMPCVGLNTTDGLLVPEGYYTMTTDGIQVAIQAVPDQADALANMGLPITGLVAIPTPKAQPPATAPAAAPPAATAPAPVAPAPAAAPPAPAAPAAAPPVPAAPPAAPAAPVAPIPDATTAVSVSPVDPTGVDVTSAPDVSKDHAKTTRGRGRPATGFTLVLAGSPQRGFAEKDTYFLDQVLHLYGIELAAASGVSSYYDLHPFRRRDAVCARAGEFAEIFGKGTVFATLNVSPDLDQFITALAPLAKRVIGTEISPTKIE